MNKRKILMFLLIITGLILSFKGFNSIDKVKDLMFKDDPDVEFIRSDQDEIKASIETDLRETVIYYEDESEHLVPIKREVAWEEGIGKAVLKNMVDSVAVREEISKIGFKPVLPKGTRVFGMVVDEATKICKVDFSSDLLNYKTKTQEKNIVKAIVYTLSEFPNIDQVQITIEGKTVDELEFGTSIEKPLKREDINLVEVSEMMQEGGYSKILVYYKGTNEQKFDYYVPITIPVSSPNISPEFAVKQLFEKAPDSLAGLYTDIPNGVEFKSAKVDDRTLVLDLDINDEEILKNQQTIDKMSKNIGLTLNQFDGIDKIKLSVEGKILQDTVPVFANEY